MLALHSYELFAVLAWLAWWSGSPWLTGYLAGGSSPEALQKLLKAEITKWSAVIGELGLKIK